ncbi:MAG: restriction endonuclease [Clostridia bacterium]|nr:restriction endonuclease [Clostridia bacterium]
MNKKEEAKEILNALQVPAGQQNDMCCLTLLALAGIENTESWENASSKWLRIHDILVFIREKYGVAYAENTRETIRKNAIHNFKNAAFVEDSGDATNCPRYSYRITDEMLELLRSFRTDKWEENLAQFQTKHDLLVNLYTSRRTRRKMPVRINGIDFSFSPGKHNLLQKAIIEEFAPRFAQESECLYVGDTVEKDLFKNTVKMRELGFDITLHDKMPDVVLYCESKRWLYFIEAVTSVGPMEPRRIMEIEEMTSSVSVGKIYVTAFPDFKTFKKFSETLAWETEIWNANLPDHMIHLNGDKFLGPRDKV